MNDRRRDPTGTHRSADAALADALSPDAIVRIESVVSRLRDERGWANFVSLQRLLRNWPHIVSTTRRYRGNIYEYQNDLDTRNILQDVVDHLGEPDAAQLLELLAPWDEAFRAATSDASNLWSRSSGGPGWWNGRMPRNPGPELSADLIERGYLTAP